MNGNHSFEHDKGGLGDWLGSLSEAVHIDGRRRMSEASAVVRALLPLWLEIEQAKAVLSDYQKKRQLPLIATLTACALIFAGSFFLATDKQLSFVVFVVLICGFVVYSYATGKETVARNLQKLLVIEQEYFFRWNSCNADPQDLLNLRNLAKGNPLDDFPGDDPSKLAIWMKLKIDLYEAASGQIAPTSARISVENFLRQREITSNRRQ